MTFGTQLPPLQRRAVPFAEVRPRLVGALQEIEDERVEVRCSAHRVVGQHELAELGEKVRGLGHHLRLGESGRRRIGVGIERRLRDGAAARPESATAAFAGIGLARHPIGEVGDGLQETARRITKRINPGRKWRIFNTYIFNTYGGQ